MTSSLPRRVLAEFVGTAFLLTAIVGSGIMAERLSTDKGLLLLQNALATAGALTAIILALGSVSGAHLNPVVTLADRLFKGLSTPATIGYIVAQLTGGAIGVMLANAMFDLPAVTLSTTARSGSHLWLAEAIATVGLLVVIFGLVRSSRVHVVAFAVGAYIAGAFYFTSSTSFANPAVTIGRMFTDTFTGIQPSGAPAFVGAQLAGMGVAVALIRGLYPRISDVADRIVVPHES